MVGQELKLFSRKVHAPLIQQACLSCPVITKPGEKAYSYLIHNTCLAHS
jgi:hypothetical protein